jgi:hypothetical protein
MPRAAHSIANARVKLITAALLVLYPSVWMGHSNGLPKAQGKLQARQARLHQLEEQMSAIQSAAEQA